MVKKEEVYIRFSVPYSGENVWKEAQVHFVLCLVKINFMIYVVLPVSDMSMTLKLNTQNF